MEFEGQYLTYEEYRALGGTLKLPSFNLLEFHARNQIDLRTLNRLVNVNTNDIPQKVKICDFDLIEKINGYTKSMNEIGEHGNVASFNSDGYSETYVTSSQIKEIVESKKQELDDIMVTGLFGVVVNGEHILFPGV